MPPSRENSPSCRTWSSLACSGRLMSPISSRNIVPWLANSNLPGFCWIAPVKAPRSKPNSSDSSSSVGSAAQFTLTNGLSRRGEARVNARATSSLPVPLSPRMSTVTSVSATRLIRSRTSPICSLCHSSSPMTRARGLAARASASGVSTASRSRPFIVVAPRDWSASLFSPTHQVPSSKASATTEQLSRYWEDVRIGGRERLRHGPLARARMEARCSGAGAGYTEWGMGRRRPAQARLMPHSLILLSRVL